MMRRNITAFAAAAVTLATLLGTAATATADTTLAARIGWVTFKECVDGGGTPLGGAGPFQWPWCKGGRYNMEWLNPLPS
ncbi:hypothetical protein AB0M80_41495 [Amycolatopsis sp. NPDC051045]|uniref:hypothetical protein n=1 Tax=Amycolatopsis sp. NPDC051045 TaxID=3156922 RepID=UPI003438026D